MSDVVIVGSGVVGTATGKGLASAGHAVTFVDINPQRLEELRAEGYEATDRIELSEEPTIVFLVLPTPSGPTGYDLSALTAGVSNVGAALGRSSGFHTVVLRSTTPPGTCDDVIRPILEATSGKTEGEGFALASNPEFLRAATALEDFLSPAMTVIGSRSTLTVQRLVELFRPFGGPVRTFSTTAEAELVKCAHNLFNAAKISFWNELWLVAEHLGFNGDEVAATVAISSEGSTNPQYGIRGGAPYGGACLPKDTVGFLGFAREIGVDMPLLSAVIEVNRTMAHRVRVELAEVTDHVEELLGPDSEALVSERPSDH
ncbi:MAG: nucleotide sugar dehydrogenase [Actinobacteria bacterium]|nr:nucleotide sugar dehydrogenase [Actinomycetota bacterium]